MKVKKVIVLAISFVGMALGFMFFLALKKHNAQAARITHIPSLELVSINGERLLLNEISSGRRTAILFFSPDCEFCLKEIEGIIENRTSLEGADWVFVTLSPLEEVEAFLMEYPIGVIQNADVCIDTDLKLFDALDIKAPPSLFIYDADGELEHYNRGAVSIKTILEWMK